MFWLGVSWPVLRANVLFLGNTHCQVQWGWVSRSAAYLERFRKRRTSLVTSVAVRAGAVGGRKETGREGANVVKYCQLENLGAADTGFFQLFWQFSCTLDITSNTLFLKELMGKVADVRKRKEEIHVTFVHLCTCEINIGCPPKMYTHFNSWLLHFENETYYNKHCLCNYSKCMYTFLGRHHIYVLFCFVFLWATSHSSNVCPSRINHTYYILGTEQSKQSPSAAGIYIPERGEKIK